ncbi:hypothetical protein [Nocardioides ochotonae]|uniref:hypothetical protein n=1 Tax=Nocardioides ochotonae TaxID=2685869 RepID=UPI001407968B|nr:hypothetical protein [Nocardioides ochotonae]
MLIPSTRDDRRDHVPSDRSWFQLDPANPTRTGPPAPPPIPGDVAVVAELTVHAGPHGPRRLHVCRRGADLVVRHLDGRLLWLETAELSAVRDPADPDRWVLERHDPDLPPRLLPRDHGVEGVAIASAEAFDDSFEAEEWEAPEATSSSRTVAGVPRRTTLLRCTLEWYGECELHVDDRTGLVLGARADRSLHLEVTALREAEAGAAAGWFAPVDRPMA